jgi:bis(5'-nucleosyl)-tetraphosphatase (symmetrical)
MWVIGDLQGCLDPLQRLLAQLPDDEPLLFVGDLVNRGPQSLATLRFVRALCEAGRARALLGNHDLHLLATAHRIRPLHDDDTLQEILDAPDRDALLDWLRARPLAHAQDGALFVHAGVLPPWTVVQTLALAREVEAQLQAPDYRRFLSTMYGNSPERWDDALTGADRARCVINALTRLRFVRPDGSMDLRRKDGPPSTAPVPAAATQGPRTGGDTGPQHALPWFDHPARVTRGDVIVFGHWSALGFVDRPDAVCLDSGCVWGGRLSALRWPQRTLVQQRCPQAQVPG